MALAALMAPTACSSRRQVLLNSDFEQFDGWLNTPAFLTSDQAYSGHYSYRVPQGQDYGATFAAPLSDLCTQIPRRLRVSSQVFLSSGRVRATMLVTQIACHGRRPDVWEALKVDQVVPRYQKWEYVQKQFRLPADLQPTDELKIYVWHVESNGDMIYFDDLRVEGWQ